jgi:hypothetical protein
METTGMDLDMDPLILRVHKKRKKAADEKIMQKQESIFRQLFCVFYVRVV